MPVALLLACALLLAACGGDDEEKAAGSSDATETPAATAEAGCEKVPAAKPKDVKLPKPTLELEQGTTYVARVLTNCGEFEIKNAGLGIRSDAGLVESVRMRRDRPRRHLDLGL